jgi:hypothetical protein
MFALRQFGGEFEALLVGIETYSIFLLNECSRNSDPENALQNQLFDFALYLKLLLWLFFRQCLPPSVNNFEHFE